jgi:hypothetical protein
VPAATHASSRSTPQGDERDRDAVTTVEEEVVQQAARDRADEQRAQREACERDGLERQDTTSAIDRIDVERTVCMRER